ncbi:PHD finger protein 8 [Pseudohyphozyma bogoriensis]|nr:PHD finger protein 8 [Pseudohyphozyma bogoriensis]
MLRSRLGQAASKAAPTSPSRRQSTSRPAGDAGWRAGDPVRFAGFSTTARKEHKLSKDASVGTGFTFGKDPIRFAPGAPENGGAASRGVETLGGTGGKGKGKEKESGAKVATDGRLSTTLRYLPLDPNSPPSSTRGSLGTSATRPSPTSSIATAPWPTQHRWDPPSPSPSISSSRSGSTMRFSPSASYCHVPRISGYNASEVGLDARMEDSFELDASVEVGSVGAVDEFGFGRVEMGVQAGSPQLKKLRDASEENGAVSRSQDAMRDLLDGIDFSEDIDMLSDNEDFHSAKETPAKPRSPHMTLRSPASRNRLHTHLPPSPLSSALEADLFSPTSALQPFASTSQAPVLPRVSPVRPSAFFAQLPKRPLIEKRAFSTSAPQREFISLDDIKDVWHEVEEKKEKSVEGREKVKVKETVNGKEKENMRTTTTRISTQPALATAGGRRRVGKPMSEKDREKAEEDAKLKRNYPSFDYNKWPGKPVVKYCGTVEAVEACLMGMTDGPFGFDLEWNPFERKKGEQSKQGKTALVQVCDQKTIMLAHVSMMTAFPPKLRAFIEDPTKIKLGMNIKGDVDKLRRDFGHCAAGYLELDHAARAVDPDRWKHMHHLMGLQRIVAAYLDRYLPKDPNVRQSRWNGFLSTEQKTYAANDVYSSLQVFMFLWENSPPGVDLYSLTRPRPAPPLSSASASNAYVHPFPSTEPDTPLVSTPSTSQPKASPEGKKRPAPRQLEAYGLWIEGRTFAEVAEEMSKLRGIKDTSVASYIVHVVASGDYPFDEESCDNWHAIESRPPPRKSSRAVKQLDYANLNSHLPADVDRWTRVLESKKVTEGKFKSVKADSLTQEWLWSDEAMREPFFIEKPEGLGMKMPPNDMSIQAIAQEVGPNTPLDVIDVASQSALSHWTLQQWATYYDDPRRDKVRNVISLEISESPFSPKVEAPAIVRTMDWVDNIWPKHLKKPGQYPRVQKYCLMSVKRCWTDWHIDFAGSSVYYHVLRGGKVFYFIRPTPENLQAYETWSGNTEMQETVWLGDMVDEVFKIELKAGNTMIIPTGWIHCVYTPSDSLVFGGNFVHSLDMAIQLRIYQIEINTKVPRKFRFPHFVKLLWYVAEHYSKILRTHPPSIPLPAELNQRVLDGLKVLSAFLIEQTTRFAKDAKVSAERKRIAKENVPSEVKDPVGLSREMRKLVLKAMGEEPDEQCFSPKTLDPDIHDAPAEPRLSPAVSRASSSTPAKPTPAKRKTETPQAGPATSKVKTKHTVTPSSSKKPARRDPGEIISEVKETVPNVTHRQELRVDPKQEELGPRPADVEEKQSTDSIVRRVVEEDGTVVMETRTIITKFERSPPMNGPPQMNGSYNNSYTAYSPTLPTYPAPPPQNYAQGYHHQGPVRERKYDSYVPHQTNGGHGEVYSGHGYVQNPPPGYPNGHVVDGHGPPQMGGHGGHAPMYR